ncbi:MAG: carbamoyltransferase HypF [Candidatus Methanomethylophilaceae archaeon]|nr:carbamoyltransferase HypF [Candidatus Methanomethylophilaceae archaeon]
MRVVVRGTVQGVGFRPAVFRAATACGASGTVRNGGSQVVIETDRPDELMAALMSDLPPLARIESVEREDVPYEGPSGFSIIHSDGSGTGASVPADSAVCDRCVREMLSPGRRHMYPFTTCTDCGPRYSLLRGIPYDRPLTSMDSFAICPECGREFSDPGDRRFHHQTICCPACGPSYRLLDAGGSPVEGDPIEMLAHALDNGCLAVVKGWGGMHICCTLDRLPHLREWYRRGQKPFAVMVRDMDALRRYAEPTPEEEARLLSPDRPIVLVRKIPSEAMEAASPGLDNVGMFLPYTGMHHVLFDHLGADALVMTSANAPGEPMVIDDAEALALGVDYYLLHNQPIINRSDDSVVRILGDRTQYIRRSRGAIPYHIPIGFWGDAVALGPQENMTGSVASDGRIWPTQHIGNGEGIGVPEFLEEAVRAQMRFVGCEPAIVAEDLHPGYANRRIARRIAEEHGAEIMDVQHHWAHAAALMAENGIDRCICLTLDGTGHGDDGTAWGGEVLDSSFEGYGRVAHLETIPLLGGEKALRDIRRLRFAIDTINGSENSDFTDSEAAILKKMMVGSVRTSSFGRFLDALSYSLGACSVRSYDGEPAMRLEPLLARGRHVDGISAENDGGTIRYTRMFQRIGGYSPEDFAYTAVESVMEELVGAAAERAESEGIREVGLTGGVSYNAPIARMFVDMVKSRELVPVLHRQVPNGDGGVSVGQAAIALGKIQ